MSNFFLTSSLSRSLSLADAARCGARLPRERRPSGRHRVKSKLLWVLPWGDRRTQLKPYRAGAEESERGAERADTAMARRGSV